VSLVLGAEIDPTVARLSAILGVFSRFVAVGWLAAGLVEWARLLGILPLGGLLFPSAPFALQVLTVVFALLTLLVAVGLWLHAAWGAVVWGAAVVGQVAAELLIVGATYPDGVIILNALTLFIYCAILLLIARRRRLSRG
jgi:hypothetical protein